MAEALHIRATSTDFNLFMLDLETGDLLLLCENMRMSTIKKFLADWEHIHEKAVFVPWPRGRELPAWMGKRVQDYDKRIARRSKKFKKLQELETELYD